MPQRKKKGIRCEVCGLHLKLCACALFPRLELANEIIIVQSIRERFKPTNTGRLFKTMVPETTLVHYGMREPPFDTSPFDVTGVHRYVLFPRDDAMVMDTENIARLRATLGSDERLGFVLLDGTWHQCSRMSRRVPRVQDLPCVALPPGPPSRWGVRTQHDPRGLSTFEAGIRLIALLEGFEKARQLQEIFWTIAARMMFMKGKLPTPDVPDAWRLDPLPGAA